MIKKIKKALWLAKEAQVGCTLTPAESAYLLGYIDGLEELAHINAPTPCDGNPPEFYSATVPTEESEDE